MSSSFHHNTLRRRKLARQYFEAINMPEEEIERQLSCPTVAAKSKAELARVIAAFTHAVFRLNKDKVISTNEANRKGLRSFAPSDSIPPFDPIRGATFEGPSPDASTSNHPSPRRGDREQSGDFTPQSHQAEVGSDDEKDTHSKTTGSSSVQDVAIIRVPSVTNVELAPLAQPRRTPPDVEDTEPGSRRPPRAMIVTVDSPPRRTLNKKGGSTRVSWNEGLDSVLATPAEHTRSAELLEMEDEAINMYDSIASVGVKRETRHDTVSLDDDDGVSRMVNEYWISHEVGHGAFGTVYQAVRTTDNKPFAIKIVSSRPRIGSTSAVASAAVSTCVTPTTLASTAEPEQLLRGIPRSVLREITIMRRFQNKHLLPLEAVLHDAERHSLFLVIPLMRGPLLQVSSRGKVTSSTYEEGEARRLIFQIATGLRYLHERRVVHLDIKPANILINDENNAVISDFGTSQIRNPGDRSPAAAGSPAYLPPEALQEDVETIEDGAAADMWALGVTWYMMLYGNHPFASGARDATSVKLRILTERLEFNDSVEVSQPCRDLIAELLDRNVATRLTSKRLRESPYMNGLFTPHTRPTRNALPIPDNENTVLPPPLITNDETRLPPALTRAGDLANLNDTFDASVRLDDQLLMSPTNQQMANAVIDVHPQTDFRPSSRPLE